MVTILPSSKKNKFFSPLFCFLLKMRTSLILVQIQIYAKNDWKMICGRLFVESTVGCFSLTGSHTSIHQIKQQQ